MAQKIRVTVWNEFRHEQQNEEIRKLYPDGMHGAIAEALNAEPDLTARVATLDEPEHGLTEEVLSQTDVLTWWGHIAHGDVQDEIVDRVHKRVLDGLGLVVLHSGHFSKIFTKLMGQSCNLKWREAAEKERLWVIDHAHPITRGLPDYIELPQTEMYGEPFGIPQPDELVFVSWFEGGEVFRSGCCYHRGRGRVFYFRPGHETYPIFYDEHVLRVIANSVRWAAPVGGPAFEFGHRQPLEGMD